MKPPASASGPSPTDVVSQFLDRVRRGGEGSGAEKLLTERAQAELKRIGRTVEPIGSPDAHFNVTQARGIEGEPNAMLVQSIWSEPAEDGTHSDFEVVWAVHRGADGWRISGLVMDVEPGQPPVVIDFENGEEMEKMLVGSEEPAGSASSTAASQAAASQAAASAGLDVTR
ncbi:hypothetical protein [Novipirellula artificiosorum]|uniref:hypothetical protein n=1 Tax=Novipirellula artificiosorum TaxID=2528016 RepID=UPI0011B7572F|nr:hypothetical protein [Novipirellula artificiosorum]